MSNPVSTIKLYKNCKIKKEKNFVVESIESYLGTLNPDVISNFQYQKHSLFLSIKIDSSEAGQEFNTTSNINYVSIQNSNSSVIVYYFVTKITPRAESTLQLELEMDTLNTFKFGTDYTASDKTMVTREHKVRFQKGLLNKYYPVIDFYSEGIQTTLFKESEKDLESPDETRWYLIYKNHSTPTEDTPVVIDCYLAPRDEISVKANSEEVYNAYNFPDGYRFAYISNLFTAGANLVVKLYNGGVETSYTFMTPTPTQYDLLEIEKVGDLFQYYMRRYTYSGGVWNYTSLGYGTLDYFKLFSNGVQLDSIDLEVSINSVYSFAEGDDNYTWEVGENVYTLRKFETLDRTDVLLNKIIELPYFPSDYEFDNGDLVIPDDWEYDTATHFLKLKNMSTTFESKITTDETDVIKICYGAIGNGERDPSKNRTDGPIDPKLHHSDYYLVKFVYDSFSISFPLETIKGSSYSSMSDYVEFTFVMTNTMNSRFLFSFDYERIYVQEDYHNILPVARNNEVVIYNSPYLNYLRTSYNYDVKAKERNLKAIQTSSVLSTIGSVAGVGLSLASRNPSVAISGVLSGVSGLANNLVNTANSIAQTEENFQKNIAQLQVQGVTTSGADDLDLLNYYSHNVAKRVIYSISDRAYKVISDIFYYFGYKTQEMKTPVVDTRYWFNFLECELAVSVGSQVNIPEECLETIKTKFREGVTFLHNHSNVYDFEQVKNNIEGSLAL